MYKKKFHILFLKNDKFDTIIYNEWLDDNKFENKNMPFFLLPKSCIRL